MAYHDLPYHVTNGRTVLQRTGGGKNWDVFFCCFLCMRDQRKMLIIMVLTHIGSMYGVSACIYHKQLPNYGKFPIPFIFQPQETSRLVMNHDEMQPHQEKKKKKNFWVCVVKMPLGKPASSMKTHGLDTATTTTTTTTTTPTTPTTTTTTTTTKKHTPFWELTSTTATNPSEKKKKTRAQPWEVDRSNPPGWGANSKRWDIFS